MCLEPTASALLSCCLDVPNARVCQRFLSRSSLLTSYLRRHPRTRLTITRKHIMISRKYFFLFCLQANTFFFRIQSLPPGPKRVESSKFDLTSYLTLSVWTVPSFALAACCVHFPFLMTLHLLKPPLMLLLLYLAILLAFNCVLTLPQPTLLQLLLSVLHPLVFLDYGIDPFHPRKDSQTG